MPMIEITNVHLLRAPLPYYHSNRISFPKHKLNLPPRTTRLPFLIKAIVEPKCNDMHIAPHHQPGPDLPEGEKLRRLRISKANKGNTPWNKGRKHSPETLQKIKERTLIAMQSPKVRMKLAFGHAQTAETRLKIGTKLRKLGEKRRGRKMVQESCHFEWQNLIAEASRQGFIGQEELLWNSYETLNAQLKRELLTAPKSLEQRKKIAQAISAKWADPEYRERVVSAMGKRHNSTSTVRKPTAP